MKPILPSKPGQRLTNFDVLRTLAMFSIVLLHCISHGLTTDVYCSFHIDTPIALFNSLASQFILFATGTGVDVFVMITGYFMVVRTDGWRRLPKLWLQTFFYAAVMALAGVMVGLLQPSLHLFLDVCFPIRQSSYWFVTMYMGLMLLSPFLSRFLQELSKSHYQQLLVVLFALNTSFAYFPYGDVYSGGFSLFWFVTLYSFAGYIRLFNPFEHERRFGIWFVLWCLVLTVVYFALVYLKYRLHDTSGVMKMRGPNYNSFTFISALLLFLWAKNTRFSPSLFVRLLVWVSPYTFGVYLFHDAKWMREMLWKHLFQTHTQLYNWYYLLWVLAVVCLVFFVGVAIDWLRQRFFALLKLDEKFTRLCQRCFRLGFKNE